MEYLPDSIGQQSIPENRDTVSEWDVYMPLGQDRDKYIKNCYRTNTISVTNSNGEIVHRVKIGTLALQQLRFPIDKEQIGSKLVCLASTYGGKLYVVDIYNQTEEYLDQLEDQYRFNKHSDKGKAELLIDKDGKILLSVDSEEESGVIEMKVVNKNKTAKLNIIVNGETSIYSSESIIVRSLKTINATIWDGKEESKKTQVVLSDNKIQHIADIVEFGRDNFEPILLGNKSLNLLDQILTQLGKESAGPYPLLGNAKYLEFKEKLEELKSQISFTQ